MSKESTYSKEWLEFKEAENNFIEKRRIFFSTDQHNQITDIGKSLAGDPNDVLFAINTLEILDINYEILLPILLEISIDGGEMASIYARNLFSKYKNSSRKEIALFVFNFLDSIEENFQNYSNIAQLLYKLDYKSDLWLFLNKYCKISTNEDILELFVDYKERLSSE